MSTLATAQIGGDHTYDFLNIPVSARVGALGGNLISVKDDDPNLSVDNPSLLNPEMNSTLSLTYIDYFADINYGYVSYVKDMKKYGTFSSGIKYINYGNFTETDEGGNELGNFTAGEYAFILGWGKALDTSWSVGANLKPVYSSLYQYNSFGIATDLGVTYYNPVRQFTASAVIKNMGMQLKPYVEGNREPLPFEVQMGVSKRLKHMPLRVSVIATHLEQWDLTYDDSTSTNTNNTTVLENNVETEPKKNYLDKAMRHVVVGAEFVPSKSFNLRFGFNYKRRKELALTNRPGMVGFSWGMGIRVKKFHLSYGSARYHLAGSTNHFTLTTKISEFYRSNKTSTPPKEKKARKKKKEQEG